MTLVFVPANIAAATERCLRRPTADVMARRRAIGATLSTILIAAGVGVSIPGKADSQRAGADTGRAITMSRGRLLGVYDDESGMPVVGASVIDVMTGDHTVTSATGTASLGFVRAKGSIVEVRKIGYAPWQAVIDPSDTTPMTVLLKHAVELPTVRTTARPEIARDAGTRDGFERRCQAANVSCVRTDVIDSHPSNSLGDLLLRSPGVLARGRKLAMHSNGMGFCEPTLLRRRTPVEHEGHGTSDRSAR